MLSLPYKRFEYMCMCAPEKERERERTERSGLFEGVLSVMELGNQKR